MLLDRFLRSEIVGIDVGAGILLCLDVLYSSTKLLESQESLKELIFAKVGDLALFRRREGHGGVSNKLQLYARAKQTPPESPDIEGHISGLCNQGYSSTRATDKIKVITWLGKTGEGG